MIFSKILKILTAFVLMACISMPAIAADYKLRMTMNSNDQDEDYDGAVVF